MFNLGQDKTIKIKCQGADVASIDDLFELQGNLKTNTDEGYEWQKNSILNLGFKFPMNIWKDESGKMWEIDGHRRLRTLKRMRDEEGYTIPLIPINYSFNENKVEAKETILAGVSAPEKVTEEGFNDFINEPDALIVEEVADTYYYDAGYLEEEETQSEETKEEKPKKEKKEKCERCENYHSRNHDE